MSDLEKWILGLAGVAFAALAGAFWKHVTADADHRERIAERFGRLEQKGKQDDHRLDDQAREIQSLREGRHSFREQITRLLADWKNELLEKIRSRRDPD